MEAFPLSGHADQAYHAKRGQDGHDGYDRHPISCGHEHEDDRRRIEDQKQPEGCGNLSSRRNGSQDCQRQEYAEGKAEAAHLPCQNSEQLRPVAHDIDIDVPGNFTGADEAKCLADEASDDGEQPQEDAKGDDAEVTEDDSEAKVEASDDDSGETEDQADEASEDDAEEE